MNLDRAYSEGADKLVRAWLKSEMIRIRIGDDREVSTDGASIFAGRECIATRAPGTQTALICAKQYTTLGPKGSLRTALRLAFERHDVARVDVHPDDPSKRIGPGALVRCWYAAARIRIEREVPTLRAPKPSPTVRKGATGGRVLPFRLRPQ